jgi:hypothetical protein
MSASLKRFMRLIMTIPLATRKRHPVAEPALAGQLRIQKI